MNEVQQTNSQSVAETKRHYSEEKDNSDTSNAAHEFGLRVTFF